MKNYKQFTISTQPFNIDILSGILWELEILGLNEYDDFLTVFVYEDSEVTKDSVENILQKLAAENVIQSYKISEEILESKNWNEEYEKKINIIEVSDKIVIKPSFKEYQPKENQIVINIDPKMSFGTGEHQTTKLIIRLLEDYLTFGDKVLDVGSGTSILGIAASKLGAKNVIAVDNDEWCFINGRENAELNNVENISVRLGTIEDIEENDFELVLANINKNVLIEIKKQLFNKVRLGGKLILSGILVTDEEEIKRQFTQIGFTALNHQILDEWLCVVFTKV